MGKAGIRAAYATGRGKVTLRARTEIVEKKNGRFAIQVSEIPYGVNKARLIEGIADLVKDKRIDGISDINDYSSREGMNICIDLKRDANPQVILNQLFSYTQLQTTFGVIMIALVNGEPKLLNLKEILQHYIDYQCEIITRRTRYNLRKAQERAHILEGLLTALDFIEEVIKILRQSKSIQEGKSALMERFGLDDVQAQAIVQMRLGQLTGLERIKIEEEMAALKEKIAEYTAILSDEGKVLALVKSETGAISEKFADERRTEIVNVTGEMDIEDLIPNETCVYTLTDMGYIKRMPMDTYQSQRRGGKGIKGMTRREEDAVHTMFNCSTHDYIMFFTTKGKTYKLKGYEIPEGSRTSKGMNIVNLLPVEPDERISAMIRVPETANGEYLCMVTRNGVIKRTALEEYKNIRKSGVIAINLDEGDELAWVKLTSGDDDLFVATKKGMGIRFRETDARAIGRTARGVRAITLRDGDEVVGMAVLTEDIKVLTVTETGYGRKSHISDYRVQSRGGFGTINYHTEKYGDVAAVAAVEEGDDVILISVEGIIIRIAANDISTFARPSKGVRVMRMGETDKLATLTCVKHEEDDEEDENSEKIANDTEMPDADVSEASDNGAVSAEETE